MATYIAHYCSPVSADVKGKGSFSFESDARVGSKENMHDARMKMLELFGKDAVSWTIDDVVKETKKNSGLDGQLEFDFRPEKKRRRRRTKEYW